MIKNKLLKYILIAALIVLSSMHIMKGIFEGFELNQMSILIFIYFAVAIFSGKREDYSSAFLIQGIMTILTMKEMNNLTPAIMFFISILYSSNIKRLLTICILIPISFVASSYINGFGTISQLVEGILFNYTFLVFLYFAVIKQPSKINHLSKVTPLSCRQLLILKYLSLDIPRKQIVDKVSEKELWKYDIDNFTLDIINSEIAKIKKILNIDSEFSLGVWYNKKTEIPE